ncbi:MAG TPA: TonB-dependent receptor, partial [Phnomibacter sp.]|nr:TonB-dependent receptor [Phnomibacter sp.]
NNRWKTIDDQGNVVTDPEQLAKLNANASIWQPLRSASSFYVHSWAIEDGSFLRVNNITLGYTIPQKITERVKIRSFRLYATVNNLYVFTNYTGYDPEVNTRRNTPLTPGVDYSAYPRSRAFIAGVNVTF